MVDELLDRDATAQAEAVERGDVSATELVEAAIERVEDRNGVFNAIIHERFEAARCEAPSATGPFAGVPFVVKDLIAHSAGDPFHEGIAGLRAAGFREDRDTALVERFRAGGLVTIGRTNTPELGVYAVTEPTAYGATRNPWNTEYSPLGSSGGTAAAVAGGIVAVGHGNDGGGSIRAPASACGLVGLKPSRGRVSLGPEFGDVVGGVVAEFALTRSVRDAATLLDIVATTDFAGEPYAPPGVASSYRRVVERAARSEDPIGLRVGVMADAPGGWATVDSECVAAVEQAGRVLERLGCVVERSHPAALDDGSTAGDLATLLPYAFTAFAFDWWERRLGRPLGPDDVEPTTWEFAQVGRGLSALQYLTAVERLQIWGREVAGWWQDFDLLLTPTVPIPPPAVGAYSDLDDLRAKMILTATLVAFTSPFNATGQPAISLPTSVSSAGVPLGTQLVAAPGREDLLLACAARVEREAPWPLVAPPMSDAPSSRHGP